MVTKEVLQKFVNEHADVITEILPGGLKDAKGKWILVCPVMERFNLDFSKVKTEKKEVVEEVVSEEKPKKSTKKKSKSK